MDMFEVCLQLLGGLGLFLFGMKKTEKVLLRVASFKFKTQIEKLTKNIFLSTLMGVIITSVVQSSSATTVILVSFINAGLISLIKSIGVIYGANIGTTITVQIISLKLQVIAIPAVGIGMMLTFTKNYIVQNIGKFVTGFGLIFLGLAIMQDSVGPLQNSTFFNQFIAHLNGHSFMGFASALILSLLLTALIHASSATIGVLIVMSHAGLITDIYTAIPIILGAKIGTCITGVMASMSSNRDGKRLAIANVLFNVITAAITIVFIDFMAKLFEATSSDITHQIANAHSITSIIATIVVIPFTKHFAKLLEYFLPIKDNENSDTVILDNELIETPPVAIASIRNALVVMSKISENMIVNSCEGIIKSDFKLISQIFRAEQKTNILQKNIEDYIMQITKNELSGHQARELNCFREMTNDFERIADHAENIAENILNIKGRECAISDDQCKIINNLKEKIVYYYKIVHHSMIQHDHVEAGITIVQLNEEKEIFKAILADLNNRMLEKSISPQTGMILIDVVYNMQRILFHFKRILFSIVKIETLNGGNGNNDNNSIENQNSEDANRLGRDD